MVRDVAVDADSVCTVGTEFIHGPVKGNLFNVSDDNVHAFGREAVRKGPAHARRSAGYESHRSFEILHHLLEFGSGRLAGLMPISSQFQEGLFEHLWHCRVHVELPSGHDIDGQPGSHALDELLNQGGGVGADDVCTQKQSR